MSKKKIILLSLASIGFVVFGILFVYDPQIFVSEYRVRFKIFNNPEMIRIIGIVATLFFGIAGIYGIKKLFDKKIGLIIDSKGITDNSSALSIGLIEWEDINRINLTRVNSIDFLMIIVKNPEKYIGKATNRIQARLMKTNMSIYKTPLSITSNTLNFDFRELEELIQKEFKRNKNVG
ncbi:hypothetical protein EC396_12855 [Lutibacter sp. HS1-25]|nr:hypothetical protein EC396_12855 [Lutibacter sp. HS1-25]